MELLRLCWLMTDGICSKRLAPVLPELLDRLRRRQALREFPIAVQARVAGRSASTVDRAVTPIREQTEAPRHLQGRGAGYTGAMQVEVHLHAELVRLAPDNSGVLTVDLAEGAQVADLLAQLALDPRRRVIVGLNGEAARLDQELPNGARIDLLTPMAGGSALARPS